VVAVSSSAGRLIGQDQRGMVGQGARYRHALLLPARHLVRAVRDPLVKADHLQNSAVYARYALSVLFPANRSMNSTFLEG